MFITHPVFIPVRFLAVPSVRLNKSSHIAVKIHFNIDTNAPIKCCPRAINIDVRNPCFDDLGYLFARFLVGRNADLWFVGSAGIVLNPGCYRARQLKSTSL